MGEDDRTRAEQEGAAFAAIFGRGVRGGEQHGAPRPPVIGVADLDTIFGRAHVPQQDRMPYRSDIINGGPVAARVICKLMCDANFSLVITDAGPSTRRTATPPDQPNTPTARSDHTSDHPATEGWYWRGWAAVVVDLASWAGVGDR